MEEKKSLDIDLECLKKYKIKGKNLLNAVEGTKTYLQNNEKLKSRLFDSDAVPLFLQISTFKTPRKVEKQIKRLKLKHSLHKKDSEICLIVPDLREFGIKDHEKHVEYYEDFLRKKGVTTKFKKIMTFHEFRTEYENFELRSGLVALYDVFLVDGRISGKVVKKCGKIFYKKRKIPTAVKLHVSKLQQHLQDTLKKTQLRIHNKGNSYAVQFGDSSMKKKKLIENLGAVIGQLDSNIPGGFQNISGLLIDTEASPSIPIYKSLENLTAIKLQKPKPQRPKAFKTLTGELTTTETLISIDPFGKIKTAKSKKKKSPGKKKESQSLWKVSDYN